MNKHECGFNWDTPSAYSNFLDVLTDFMRRPADKDPKIHLNDFISRVSLYALSLRNCPRCLSLL